jgi:hypothetical protein
MKKTFLLIPLLALLLCVPLVRCDQGVSSLCARSDVWELTYSTSAIDQAIAVMNNEGLTYYRMSFDPSFTDWATYIQYFFDHCSGNLIVDYYHYTSFTTMSSADWVASTAEGIAIATAFPAYTSRLFLEPQNEQLDSNLITRTQAYVTALRNAGEDNPIVSDVFWMQDIADMAVITDTEDSFYSGFHIYFNDGLTQLWSLTQVEQQMTDGLNAGVKIINTEVGASTGGNQYFNSLNVGEVTDFLTWGEAHSVVNCVWLMAGSYEYQYYKTSGLIFPDAMEPTPTPVAPYRNSDNFNALLILLFAGAVGYILWSLLKGKLND